MRQIADIVTPVPGSFACGCGVTSHEQRQQQHKLTRKAYRSVLESEQGQKEQRRDNNGGAQQEDYPLHMHCTILASH